MTTNSELQQRREAVIPPGYTSGSAIYVASARGAVITDEQLDKGMTILEESIAALSAKGEMRR